MKIIFWLSHRCLRVKIKRKRERKMVIDEREKNKQWVSIR